MKRVIHLILIILILISPTYAYDLTKIIGANELTTSVNCGEEVTVKYNDIPGFKFKRWVSEGINLVNQKSKHQNIVMPENDVRLEVELEVQEYSIIYNLNGGTATNPTSYNITSNIVLNNPTRKGYEFVGWTGSNGKFPTLTVRIPPGSTGDREYTANWNIITYNIDYNLNGGSASNPTTYTVENNITLNNPTKKGYKFLGWTGSNGTTPETTVTIPKGTIDDKEYTANWELEVYTITYNLDGGSASNPTSYTINSSTIALNAPIKDGYKFIGWTGSNGRTPALNVTIQTGSTGNREYTANWQQNRFLVKVSKIGEYVTYIPSRTSYTTSKEYNGVSDQNFIPKETTEWQVLINDGEKVTLISADIAGELSVGGEDGYRYFKSNLNNVCAAYKNSTYATSGRSVNFDDISVLTKANVLEIGTSYWAAYTRSETDGFAYGVWTDYYGGYIDGNGRKQEVRLFHNGSGGPVGYWPNKSETGGNGFRPVIVLKPEVLASGGSGTQEDPWTISISK